MRVIKLKTSGKLLHNAYTQSTYRTIYTLWYAWLEQPTNAIISHLSPIRNLSIFLPFVPECQLMVWRLRLPPPPLRTLALKPRRGAKCIHGNWPQVRWDTNGRQGMCVAQMQHSYDDAADVDAHLELQLSLPD